MIRVQAQEEINVIIAKLGSWIRNADKNHDQFQRRCYSQSLADTFGGVEQRESSQSALRD